MELRYAIAVKCSGAILRSGWLLLKLNRSSHHLAESLEKLAFEEKCDIGDM